MFSDLQILGVTAQAQLARRVIPASAESGEGYWVGAAQAIWDGDRVLAAWREHDPQDGTLDGGGHTVVIAESRDFGGHWDIVNEISKWNLGATSMEVAALRRTRAGELEVFISHTRMHDGRWEIARVTAAEPEWLDARRHEPVFVPELIAVHGMDAAVHGVTDPVPWSTGAAFVSAIETPRGPAPTYLAIARGRRWEARDRVLDVGDAGAWDAHRARFTGGLNLGSAGLLGFYDGAATPADDTREKAGIVWSDHDLRTWHKLTPGAPIFRSPHGRGCLRYIFPVVLPDERVLLFWEREEVDGSYALWAGQTSIPALRRVGRADPS